MANRSCGTCRGTFHLGKPPVRASASEVADDGSYIAGSSAIGLSQYSNRICKGYSIRLSWPKANVKRRAVVARSLLQQRSTGHRFSDARLVNASTWDIEMHRHLSGVAVNGGAVHCGDFCDQREDRNSDAL
ncbi:hypothetical protein N7508_009833 [Penicillium antarcticum]|uniref:uncharacterized protein n=1 Tax=Penicillium antarcticum TaxID=416450 RepID=UPI00238B4FEC|nr:uncharacterized protein N7508_009833 [Penicillium antarcticum]KAJ5295012.1 hypothetical protein N7508_009833 [Penicillium antarcticum]